MNDAVTNTVTKGGGDNGAPVAKEPTTETASPRENSLIPERRATGTDAKKSSSGHGRRRPKIRKLTERHQDIVRARQSGKTLDKIAKQFNVTKQRVQQILKASGFKKIFDMRQCALPECKIAFYPLRAWQKFHSSTCAVKDRKRRQRERYRKLLTMNSGDIAKGIGGRKVIRRGSKDITKSEADIIARIRSIGQAAMDAIQAMLDAGDTSAATPTPASHSPPQPLSRPQPSRPTMRSHRIRNIGRVHPRSLENQ